MRWDSFLKINTILYLIEIIAQNMGYCQVVILPHWFWDTQRADIYNLTRTEDFCMNNYKCPSNTKVEGELVVPMMAVPSHFDEVNT